MIYDAAKQEDKLYVLEYEEEPLEKRKQGKMFNTLDPFTDPSSPIRSSNSTINGNVDIEETIILDKTVDIGNDGKDILSTTILSDSPSLYTSFPQQYAASSVGTLSDAGTANYSFISDVSNVHSTYSHLHQRQKINKRRRRRPWDDEEKENPSFAMPANSSFNQQQVKPVQARHIPTDTDSVSTSESVTNIGEETPLLSCSYTDKMNANYRLNALATTQKRHNKRSSIIGSSNLSSIQAEESNTFNQNNKCNLNSRPVSALRWSGGFFGSGSRSEQVDRKDKDSSILDKLRFLSRSGDVDVSTDFNHGNDPGKTYGSISPSSQKNSALPSDFDTRSYENNTPQNSTTFVNVYSLCIVGHFILMCGYESFLTYRSYRVSESSNDNINNSSEEMTYSNYVPSLWSYEGRILNPTIGPNPTTLNLFGALNPVLVLLQSQSWRIITALMMNSSLLEIFLNMCVLKFTVRVIELKYGSYNMFGIFLLSAFAGGVFSVLMSCFEQNNNDGVVISTGLCSAGVVGLVSLGVVDSFSSLQNVRHNKNSSKVGVGIPSKAGIGNSTTSKLSYSARIRLIMVPCVCLFLELLNGALLLYTSFSSIIIGAVMGLSCAMFLLPIILSRLDDNFIQISKSSSSTDIDSKFDTIFNTPPRDMLYGASISDIPPPPSSSSKGGDTPLMRRSIINNPEDEEEDIAIHSTIMKNCALHNNNHSAYTRKGSQKIIQLIKILGLCIGLLITVVPLALLGIGIAEPPSGLSLSDSINGCKTLRGLYHYSVVNDANDNAIDDDGGEIDEENDNSILCGETCVPLSLLSLAMKRDSNLWLTGGRCSTLGYICPLTTDTLELGGKYTVSSDFYERSTSGDSCDS